MVRGPIELPLGELIQDKITGEWHYKGERRDHPDWSTFNQIFHRFWNLLERGCRFQPGTEVFKTVLSICASQFNSHKDNLRSELKIEIAHHCTPVTNPHV